MKIKDKKDKNIEKPIIFDEDDAEKFKDIILGGGLPSEDSHGHSVHYNFRVNKVQRSIFDSLIEKYPGFFRNRSQLFRKVLHIGCLVTFKVLDPKLKDKEIKEALRELEKMNQLEKMLAEDQLDKDIENMKHRVKSLNYPKEKEFKVINFIDKSMSKQKESFFS